MSAIRHGVKISRSWEAGKLGRWGAEKLKADKLKAQSGKDRR